MSDTVERISHQDKCNSTTCISNDFFVFINDKLEKLKEWEREILLKAFRDFRDWTIDYEELKRQINSPELLVDDWICTNKLSPEYLTLEHLYYLERFNEASITINNWTWTWSAVAINYKWRTFVLTNSHVVLNWYNLNWTRYTREKGWRWEYLYHWYDSRWRFVLMTLIAINTSWSWPTAIIPHNKEHVDWAILEIIPPNKNDERYMSALWKVRPKLAFDIKIWKTTRWYNPLWSNVIPINLNDRDRDESWKYIAIWNPSWNSGVSDECSNWDFELSLNDDTEELDLDKIVKLDPSVIWDKSKQVRSWYSWWWVIDIETWRLVWITSYTWSNKWYATPIHMFFPILDKLTEKKWSRYLVPARNVYVESTWPEGWITEEYKEWE